ncbi:MAG: ATP-binding protein [Marvinbryantia sp.]|jgi:signal transduction histidine kinase
MNLLLQSEDTKENREMAAELFKIEQYTNMALQYLRLGSSTNDFLLQPYAMDDMIRQAVRKYAKLFISSKIALDFQETGITLITDEKWMVFVIEQILSNALKYTKKGKISIYASGNDCLVIEDTGIGISAEDLPRVFEKGYTGYNGRMDKKATGLGLYLCRQILNKLGHKIEIFSKPDEGTRVCITVRQENNATLQNGKVFD